MEAPMQHRFTPTTLLITGGLLLWVAVFVFLYTFAAVACARRFAHIDIIGLPLIPSVSIAVCALGATINLYLVRRGWRDHRQTSLDEHSRFLGFVTLATSALGLVALLMLALPPLLIEACNR
jgi:hypothetical protein